MSNPIPQPAPQAQSNPELGGLQALIRIALSHSPSGTVQLAFAEQDGYLFQLPEYAIAKVAEGQVVFAWDASPDDVTRVLAIADPLNWSAGEMPEQFYVARTEMAGDEL